MNQAALATTGVTIDPELLKKLKAKAASQRRSISSLLEEWIREELAK